MVVTIKVMVWYKVQLYVTFFVQHIGMAHVGWPKWSRVILWSHQVFDLKVQNILCKTTQYIPKVSFNFLILIYAFWNMTMDTKKPNPDGGDPNIRKPQANFSISLLVFSPSKPTSPIQKSIILDGDLKLCTNLKLKIILGYNWVSIISIISLVLFPFWYSVYLPY